MFTGIVEGLGSIDSLQGSTLTLRVPRRFSRLKKGSSFSVNGACLTVVKSGRKPSFNLLRETLSRTTFKALRPGDRVNLERPMKAQGRLHGHLVLGHVDGVGRVARVVESSRDKSFFILCPARLRRFCVEKGSIAVDGASLTLGKRGRGGFWVHLIPHTLKNTICGRYAPGTRVNLEADVLAKLARNR